MWSGNCHLGFGDNELMPYDQAEGYCSLSPQIRQFCHNCKEVLVIVHDCVFIRSGPLWSIFASFASLPLAFAWTDHLESIGNT